MLIAHLSDLHCPGDNPEQEDALVTSVSAAKPDLIIVSGDLTHAGRRKEFAAARDLLARFPAPQLVVPGNHDVPLLNAVERLQSPFGRFRAAFPPDHQVLEFPGLAVVGLNTATSMQASLDWSLGWAMEHRIARAVSALKRSEPSAFRIVTCHHPLLMESHDTQRSRTRNGPHAFHELAKAGMDMLLHGHLHRQKSRMVTCEGRNVTIVGAGTALGDRERGEPSGYNLIAVSGHAAEVMPLRWDGRCFVRDTTAVAA
jgi:3',5'-cyclic AMP phosphodiesterase CpdA